MSFDSECTTVAFSPNGRWLAANSANKLFVWDLLSQGLSHVFADHSSGIYRAVFSPDSNLLASASDDHTLKLWDLKTKQLVTTLKAHKDGVRCAAFSPDGKVLASGGYDTSIRLWDIESKCEMQVINYNSDWIYAVAFSANGALIASTHYDHIIRIKSLASQNTPVTLLIGHSDLVSGIAFFPKEPYLASTSWDGTTKLWDIDHRKAIVSLESGSGPTSALAISPNGKIVATGNDEGEILLWNTEDIKNSIALIPYQPAKHQAEVSALAFHPEAPVLASGGFDCKLRLWQLEFSTVGHKTPVYTKRAKN